MTNEGKAIIGILGVGVFSLVVITASYIDDNIRNRQQFKSAKMFKDLLEKSYLENDKLKQELRKYQK